MKKGYYIHFQGRVSIGVSKKIDMQIEEFNKTFNIKEIDVETITRNLFQRVIGLFPTASISRNYKNALEKIENPDFLYVRRTVAEKAYLNFFKTIREKYPDCKIIIEIFTYPYDKDDYGKWNAWPFYIKELIYRNRLKNYVNRFVTYTQDDEIFGIPTICTTNGIRINSVRKIRGEFKENQITMIGVAYMQRQHGYERIIEGMKNYYTSQDRNYRVYLYLVGEGPEKEKYENLVKKYRLQKYVNFYPTMTGKELDDLYDTCDLALAAFGMYKVGFYNKLGALKTRECLAKGMPMLSGSPIDVLDKTFRYAKIFPNDGTTVNIMDIIDYFEAIKAGTNKMEIADKIREFAVKHVSMDIVMRPIIKYLDSE